jgi:hypothetical protein
MPSDNENSIEIEKSLNSYLMGKQLGGLQKPYLVAEKQIQGGY